MKHNSIGQPQALAPTRVRNKVNKCVKNVKWRKEEDELLMKLMKSTEHPNYSRMAEQFPGKTGQQVAERWDKVLNPELVKGSWTRQEDEIIMRFVQENGTKNWRKLCDLLPGRIGKQCRERWRNHLDPSINHSPWTPEEDRLLMKYHEQFGNKWVQISQLIPNRSDNAIKNRWNATLKKLSLVTPKIEKVQKEDVVIQEIPQTPATQPTPSPLSTPQINSGLGTSPFITTLSAFGIFSPGVVVSEKKDQSKGPSLSLADNRAKLLEMIPKI